MNKVAICFFGNLRNYRATIHEVLEYYGKDADYFISTSDIAHNMKTHHHVEQIDQSVIDEIFEGYNLVASRIRDSKKIALKLNGHPNNQFASMYVWKDVLCLKMEHELKTNTMYDITVLVRPDLFMRAPNYKNAPYHVDTSREWISTGHKNFTCFANHFFALDDICLTGTNRVMNMLASNVQFISIEDGYNIAPHGAQEGFAAFLARYNISPLDERHHRQMFGGPFPDAETEYNNGLAPINFHAPE